MNPQPKEHLMDRSMDVRSLRTAGLHDAADLLESLHRDDAQRTAGPPGSVAPEGVARVDDRPVTQPGAVSVPMFSQSPAEAARDAELRRIGQGMLDEMRAKGILGGWHDGGAA